MANNILFVYEGEKTEEKIVGNIVKYYLNKENFIISIYGNNIYELYDEISNENDLDVFELLKEKNINKKELKKFNRKNISQIYLFFDYDGHDTKADDAKLKEMLNIFNDETNNGKLFISYPMIEAIKHYSSKIDFKTLTAKAKEIEKYKNRVNEETDSKYKDFRKYTKKITDFLVEQHLMKANHIVNNELLYQVKISCKMKYMIIN